MWRKWAPLGYRILRISHILHANPGSQASGSPGYRRPHGYFRKAAAVIVDP